MVGDGLDLEIISIVPLSNIVLLAEVGSKGDLDLGSYVYRYELIVIYGF